MMAPSEPSDREITDARQKRQAEQPPSQFSEPLSTLLDLKDLFKNLDLSQTESPSPAEKRKTFKTKIAGWLAVGLWVGLIIVYLGHLTAIVYLSVLLVNPPASDDPTRLERFDRSFVAINDTAKTIYSFLTPLATAITSYYFVTELVAGRDETFPDS